MMSLLVASALVSSSAQSPCPYARLKEDDLMETCWQYEATLHLPSGQVVHQGGDQYSSFLLFRFDGAVEEMTLGVHKKGFWSYGEGFLMLSYRDMEGFCAEISGQDRLLLHFRRPENRQAYAYRFRQVPLRTSPFPRSPHDLPPVIVERQSAGHSSAENDRIPWWAFWRRWWREPSPPPPPLVPITIEVSGGGYYGGLNPVSRQFVRISSDGSILREILTRREGLIVTRTRIPRAELEAFAEWMEERGYFRLNREYDCREETCFRRKGERPRPVPLQLMVAYGTQRHVLTLSVFGPDHHQDHYIDYPQLIDQIVETVYRMADRPPPGK